MGFSSSASIRADNRQNTAVFSIGEDGSICEESAPPPAPTALETGAAAAWDGDRYLYFLFGAKYEEGRYDCMRFDLSLAAWDPVALPDTPYAQGAGDSLAYVQEEHRSYLYAVIGLASSQAEDRGVEERVSAFVRLQVEPTVKSSWEVLEEFAFCVDDGSSLSVTDEYIYFLHGCDCGDQPVKTFWRYSIQAQQRETDLQPIPARTGANDGASLAWDGVRFIYATVGGAGESAKGALGDEFFRFDTEAESPDSQWQVLESQPCRLGDAPGNRLAVLYGYLFLWQGSSTGSTIYRMQLERRPQTPRPTVSLHQRRCSRLHTK